MKKTAHGHGFMVLQSNQIEGLRELAVEFIRADTANGVQAIPINTGHPHTSTFRSRSEVHEAFLQAIDASEPHQRPPGLPQRLMLFGVASLPMQTVEALFALGRVCQVLMLVQNPCQHFWGHIVESKVPLAKLARQQLPQLCLILILEVVSMTKHAMR